MKIKDKNIQAFFSLIRAGLWEKEVRLVPSGGIDFAEVFRLAEEQSVVGLVAAGIEHIVDAKPQEKDLLQFVNVTESLMIQNQAMNYFIGIMVEKMREAGIFTVLVKGQGVGQCYERPLWRSCGDVDLFFDAENYEKAKGFLTPLASEVEPEDKRKKHLAMTIDPWLVELHGLMPTEISERINAGVKQVQNDIFAGGGVRVWKNDGADVPLPSPDNDVIIVFTHFLQHFFVGGVGLRQICDWCRLLWTYRESIDRDLLLRRLQEMGIVSEWKAFGAFAVEYLGLPAEALPLLATGGLWSRKAKRICRVVLDAGNFGHNKDNSYRSRYPLLVEKSITFSRRIVEYVQLFSIFPADAPRFFVTYVGRRVKRLFNEIVDNKKHNINHVRKKNDLSVPGAYE